MKSLMIAITLLGMMCTLSSASTWLHFNRNTRNLPYFPKMDDLGYQVSVYYVKNCTIHTTTYCVVWKGHDVVNVMNYLKQNNQYGPVDNTLEEDEPCYGRKCTHSDYCCPGSICVSIDGGEFCSVFVLYMMMF